MYNALITSKRGNLKLVVLRDITAQGEKTAWENWQATELELWLCALIQSFSHLNYGKQSRSCIPCRPYCTYVLVMGVLPTGTVEDPCPQGLYVHLRWIAIAVRSAADLLLIPCIPTSHTFTSSQTLPAQGIIGLYEDFGMAHVMHYMCVHERTYKKQC